jgi:hypothetical protein
MTDREGRVDACRRSGHGIATRAAEGSRPTAAPIEHDAFTFAFAARSAYLSDRVIQTSGVFTPAVIAPGQIPIRWNHLIG